MSRDLRFSSGCKLLLGLLALSVLMSFVQWLAFPLNGGAQDLVYGLGGSRHLKLAAALRSINASPALRSVDDFWQRQLNHPRNVLLAWVGVIDKPDEIYFWATTTTKPMPLWVNPLKSLAFALGTVLIYGPGLFLAGFAGGEVLRRRRRSGARGRPQA